MKGMVTRAEYLELLKLKYLTENPGITMSEVIDRELVDKTEPQITHISDDSKILGGLMAEGRIIAAKVNHSLNYGVAGRELNGDESAEGESPGSTFDKIREHLDRRETVEDTSGSAESSGESDGDGGG
jgi:hypothetical protein